MREGAAAAAAGASDWRPPAKRRWGKADGRAMAHAFAESGETKAAFARRHGLDAERVRRWLREVGEPERKHEPVTFVPVQVVEHAPKRRGGVEIVVGARVVRVSVGFCKDTLLEVLAALESVAC
jgi:transposase-like protein